MESPFWSLASTKKLGKSRKVIPAKSLAMRTPYHIREKSRWSRDAMRLPTKTTSRKAVESLMMASFTAHIAKTAGFGM